MMTESGGLYPFIVMNTDQSDKKITHWWSSLDLHPKKEIFLFNSFGFEGSKEFILMIRKYLTRYFMVLKSLIKETIKSL